MDVRGRCVYDYAKGEYALYGGGRVPAPGKLSESRYEPQNAFWIGTAHDDWGNFARGVAIDDLRITGRKLDTGQITELRTRTPVSSEPQMLPGDGAAGSDSSGINVDNDLPPDLMPQGIRSDSVPVGFGDQGQPIFRSDFVGPSCDSQDDCASSTYCGWDRMCHPETHAPMQAFDPLFVPAGTLAPLPDQEPDDEDDSEAMGTARLTETLVGCGDTDILVWDGGSSQVGLLRPPSESDGVERGIHYLVVCSNNNNNQRIKGLRVYGNGWDASGQRTPYNRSDEDDRSGCSAWRKPKFCDYTRVGTGVVIHYTRASGRNEQIVGLQLICRRIGLENE